MKLYSLVHQQTLRALGITSEELEVLRNPDPSHLHDPFLYKDMRELVGFLHRFKQDQITNPNQLLVVMPDYDTDGIASAAVLTAALSAFEIEHRIYVPSMSEGYGLSARIVDKMKDQYEMDGLEVKMILTADNGIRAFEGVKRAKELGITVLITDHHLGAEDLPEALALVNPNRSDDLYPFKGNAGATVAWKTMLAYATMYDKEKLDMIQRLIVFSGLANIADVMPILDENRYMVKSAVEIVNHMRAQSYSVDTVEYDRIMDTPYPGYNVVFHGLYDLITLLQESKDTERARLNKSPVPLPDNEELFGWYISPLLNAPRRVHDTSLEGMIAFLSTDRDLRHQGIRALITLNKKRGELRDKVLDGMDGSHTRETGTVMCANTRGGISGLIAGKLSNDTQLPSVVFSHNDEGDTTIIYDTPPKHANRISASARSNQMYPLDMILEAINAKHPGLASGGGHVAAAGFNIKASDYETFVKVFHEVVPMVYDDVAKNMTTKVVPTNDIAIDITTPNSIIVSTNDVINNELLLQEHSMDASIFADGIKRTVAYQEQLRPFGHEFDGKTRFELVFDDLIYTMSWDPTFWKTFKFKFHGIEVLTFNPQWADQVKRDLDFGHTIRASAELKLNEFRGRVTPQIILSPRS